MKHCAARRARQLQRWTAMKLLPPPDHKLSLLGVYIGYPIGKLMLRALTWGNYPPEDRRHNALFVALTPYWLVGAVLTFVFI